MKPIIRFCTNADFLNCIQLSISYKRINRSAITKMNQRSRYNAHYMLTLQSTTAINLLNKNSAVYSFLHTNTEPTSTLVMKQITKKFLRLNQSHLQVAHMSKAGALKLLTPFNIHSLHHFANQPTNNRDNKAEGENYD